MSTLSHEKLIEDLEVWLHENQLWFSDLKQSGEKFYFIRDKERITIPKELQEICHHLQKNK